MFIRISNQNSQVKLTWYVLFNCMSGKKETATHLFADTRIIFVLHVIRFIFCVPVVVVSYCMTKQHEKKTKNLHFYINRGLFRTPVTKNKSKKKKKPFSVPTLGSWARRDSLVPIIKKTFCTATSTFIFVVEFKMIRMLTQSTSVYIKIYWGKNVSHLQIPWDLSLYIYFYLFEKRKGRKLSYPVLFFFFLKSTHPHQTHPYKTLTHQTMKIVSVLHIDK